MKKFDCVVESSDFEDRGFGGVDCVCTIVAITAICGGSHGWDEGQ
jgi:hypothetical protein